MLLQMRQMMTL